MRIAAVIASLIALSNAAQAQTDIVANPVPCPGNEKCNVVSISVYGQSGALIFSRDELYCARNAITGHKDCEAARERD